MACGALHAASKVEVEKKGTYVYWFSYKDADGRDQVTLPARFKGKSGELDVKALGDQFSDAKLHVMDKSTGNTAVVDYTPPEDEEEPKPIKLKQDDFQYVRTVKLTIVSQDGEPIESAVVNITDGDGTPMRAIVTPADEGVASFESVASGEINVKVTADGLTKTIDSDINLPLKRKTAGFAEDIRVAGDVHTLPVAKPAEKPAAKEVKSRGSSLILQTIAGLVLLIVVIAIIYAIIKSRGVSTAEALKKMGVQLPADQQTEGGAATAAEPGIDPSVCQFCGQKKDVAGNCACTVGPTAAPAGAPAQSEGTGPRLVGAQGTYSGHIFEISSGSVVVGRETGDIVLSNDTTVSRHHATITAADGDYSIRDEGSSNGTFVNGARVTEQKLTPGDEVQIGGTKFRFEV